MASPEQAAFIKELKKKVEDEINRKEMETILYWKEELEKVLAKRHESLGAFYLEIQNYLHRMQNRLKILKSSQPK